MMRISQSAACVSAIAAALVVTTALTQGASKNFVPDVVFTGSSLSDAAVVDLNKDGAAEIIVSTRRGTFILWNNWKKPAAISSR